MSEATELKDFCPISLVSGIYKIISKVLANRLRLVMSRIIFTPQKMLLSRADKSWTRSLLPVKAWTSVLSQENRVAMQVRHGKGL